MVETGRRDEGQKEEAGGDDLSPLAVSPPAHALRSVSARMTGRNRGRGHERGGKQRRAMRENKAEGGEYRRGVAVGGECSK
jgi:hypothetical protein